MFCFLGFYSLLADPNLKKVDLSETIKLSVLCFPLSIVGGLKEIFLVSMRTYLGRRPTLGQAQLEMILHGSEEVLETFGCTIQEALEEKLLHQGAQIRKLPHRKRRKESDFPSDHCCVREAKSVLRIVALRC